MKPPTIWMNMVLYIEKSDGHNIFHAIMVPKTLQPYILYECYNALGHIWFHKIIPFH